MSVSFLEQFSRYRASDKTALVCGDTALTYAELYDRCRSLASELRCLGVGLEPTLPGGYDIYNPKRARHSPWVVIVSERSENPVIGAIAAWMAGGAYVMMDDGVPEAYIQSVVDDTAASAVLRDGVLSPAVSGVDFTVSFPEEDEIACAVFTSGSTGKPKGAVLSHRVFSEMLEWQTEYMKPAHMTATAVYAPLGFIAALWELFFPLANGLTLHMLDENTRHDLFVLERYIESNDISYMFLPPNIAEIFTEAYSGNALKYLRVAGGRLKACGDPGGRYEVLYHLGMSENGGSVTFKSIRSAMNGDIPIGKAWNRTKVRLDEGEMIVSGPSLFRGYLGRRDETEEKLSGGEYRSGDLVRLDENGEFMHTGRRDWSVKIRDMKVNLLQVESALESCAGVSECCVTVQEGALIGWYAGGAGETALNAALSAVLPEYMVPSVCIKLEKLPRNSNGKIDRTSLVYTKRGSGAANTADMSEAERRIAVIFESLLELPDCTVGAEDSFIQLGGDSLKLMRLQAELAHSFSRHIPYAALFENPTPRGTAVLLRNLSEYSPIPEAHTPEDTYPLGAPMRQMWLLWRTGQDRGKYTVSVKCRFSGEIDKKRVVGAFTELTRRHAVLRSRFILQDGEPYQIIEDCVRVSIRDAARREFDLTKTPLFDITLEDNMLCFTTHHIIADAAGLRVLMEDFWTLYNGAEPQNAAQVHDVNMWVLDKTLNYGNEYWVTLLSKETGNGILPYDFPRPDRLVTAHRETVFFSSEETALLREYAANHNATLFQLFLAAYALLLSKLTGANTIIGVPFSGREHPDTVRTVGMLVKTLPLILEVSGMSLEEALEHTRGRFISAWENQNVSLEQLTEIASRPRTASRNLFYDVMINYVPLPRLLPDVEGLKPQILRSEYPAALFDLILDLREESDGAAAVLTYAGELFKPETIRHWLSALKKLLLTHKPDGIGTYAAPVAQAESYAGAFDEAAPQAVELMAVWKDILHTEAAAPDDDFFTAGGTSLDAIRIEAALFERGWFLSAADIFQNPVLQKMAALIIPAEDIDWEADE